MSYLVFGQASHTYCIPDVPTITVGNESACIGYRLSYYGAILPAYVRDDGYVLKLRDRAGYQPLDAQTIARAQTAGVLPTPLPPYSVPASSYLYGFSLWPALVLIAVVTVLRRRLARRRHAAAHPAGAGAITTGIEITAKHNVLLLIQLAAPTFEIDGQSHTRAWGTWTFDVPPGNYEIAATYGWLWRRAHATARLRVTAGAITRVTYHVGFFGGMMKVEETMPHARVAAP